MKIEANLEERTVTKLGVIVVNIFSGVGKRLGHAGSANPIRSKSESTHNNNNNLGEYENSIAEEHEDDVTV